MSAELNVPLLGEIPIEPEIAETGDAGVPIVAAKPDSKIAKLYHIIASAVAAQLSIVNMKEVAAAPAIDIQWQAKQP
jgi:ATP-binding protein involved in chromosome partitioning